MWISKLEIDWISRRRNCLQGRYKRPKRTTKEAGKIVSFACTFLSQAAKSRSASVNSTEDHTGDGPARGILWHAARSPPPQQCRSPFHARSATISNICDMRVAFLLPRYRLTSFGPEVQTSIPPLKNHAARSQSTAGTGINFRKAGTCARRHLLAGPSRGPPTIAQDDPARGKIVHSLQPGGPAPWSCSLRDIWRKRLHQNTERDGTQSQEELFHVHIAFTRLD